MAAAALDRDPGYRVRPLTREAFDLLVAAGVYAEERVELLEGEVVEVAPQGPEHGDALSRLGRALQRALDAAAPDRFLVRPQVPLAATEHSEPEPDLAVVDDAASSAEAHPSTAHLVVEVAWSSHRIDLVRKPAIYAATGIGQYWVVDLVARQVVVHTEAFPADGANRPGYATVRRLPLDTDLDLLGITVRLSQILR